MSGLDSHALNLTPRPNLSLHSFILADTRTHICLHGAGMEFGHCVIRLLPSGEHITPPFLYFPLFPFRFIHMNFTSHISLWRISPHTHTNLHHRVFPFVRHKQNDHPPISPNFSHILSSTSSFHEAQLRD